MGTFYTVAFKIGGQVKPEETGRKAEKEIKYICTKYGLDILENKSGFCSEGYESEIE